LGYYLHNIYFLFDIVNCTHISYMPGHQIGVSQNFLEIRMAYWSDMPDT
jgi:hypothetical protein